MSNYGESYYLKELEEMKKEKVVTIIPNKQIIMDKSDLDFIHKQYEDKIADLEAKLAESEETIKNNSYNKWLKAEAERFKSEYQSLKGYVDQLEQQLAEKDQAIESLQEINKSLGQTCNNDAKEIEFLQKTLEELCKEKDELISKYRYWQTECFMTKKQTAIAVLEEMLDNEVYINSKLDFEDGNYVLSKIIRTKIEKLKNGRN